MNSVVEDYDRLDQDAGYAVLKDWTCLRVTGADRASFLNNLCTNDVAKLRPGEGCEAFFTDVKGHILAHVMLLCRPDEIFLWTVPGQAEPLLAHLDRYIIREDVALQDLSPGAGLVAVVGDKRWHALGGDHSNNLRQSLSNLQVSLRQVDAIIAECDWFGPSAILVQISLEAANAFENQLADRNAAAVDRRALEILRVESGTPLFGVDFDSHNLPQEVNRDERAISLTKGCYLGQETVARIDALGHVNKLLVGVRFAAREVPPVGMHLVAGEKEVGNVTSAVWSPRLGAPLGLAMVRRGTNEAGTILSSTAGAAEVLPLPPLLDVER